MSVYKGTQLIATNGAPGAPGRDGADAGIQIVSNFTELHNNINAQGIVEQTNKSLGSSWSSVGGYGSSINAGQASIVFGYQNSLSDAQTASVFGYNNRCSNIGQGGLVSGKDNMISSLGKGSIVFGYENTVTYAPDGFTVLGYGHNIDRNLHITNGSIIAGYCVTKDSTLPIMPHQRPSYESTDLIHIGLKAANGEDAIYVRNDGCVGIAGDLGFTAVDSGGNTIGRYTLGEIVKALQNAGILTPSV